MVHRQLVLFSWSGRHRGDKGIATLVQYMYKMSNPKVFSLYGDELVLFSIICKEINCRPSKDKEFAYVVEMTVESNQVGLGGICIS